MSFWDCFTDPVLRASTWGTLLMGVGCALMGVVLLLRKESLLGESLSHATYPGIVGAILVFSSLFSDASEQGIFFAVFVGAFISAAGALRVIQSLQKKDKVSSDVALCLVISFSMGIGVVAMSALQLFFPSFQRYVSILLFGQAATLTDTHVAIYASMTALIVLFFLRFFRPLQAFLFDRAFAKSAGIPVSSLEKMIFILFLFSIVIGIRSSGIVLISGMTLAPAIAARFFSNHLRSILILSALFALLSGAIGNFLAANYGFPTGPTIVLTGSVFAFFSLLLAPQKGWLFRRLRIAFFHKKVREENLLKTLWKQKTLLASHVNFWTSFRLKRHGWMEQKGDTLQLTSDGMRKAASVVRLHRLWELYLTQTLGWHLDEVHSSAEEMEHILTPELEAKLTEHLSNPLIDPHLQPIPEKYTP